MKSLERYLGYAVLAVVGLFLVGQIARPIKTVAGYSPAPGMDLEAFSRLPVMSAGRVKPFDTVANHHLTQISHRSEYQPKTIDEKRPPLRPAIEWYLTTAAQGGVSGPASALRVFRIENIDVLDLFKLPPRVGSYRYALDELAPNIDAFLKASAPANAKDSKTWSIYERDLIALGRKIAVFEKVAGRSDVQSLPPTKAGGDWTSPGEIDRKIKDSHDKEVRREVIDGVRDELAKAGIDANELSEERQEGLGRMVAAQIDSRLAKFVADEAPTMHPAYADFIAILAKFQGGDADGFNRAVSEFRAKHYTFVDGSEPTRAEVESYQNKLSPFYWSITFYVVAGVLGLLSWIPYPRPEAARAFYRAAFMLLAFTFMMHTGALVMRSIVSGRPPVTNLYSSAVFIGWGAVALALLVELLFRNGINLVVGATIGALTMMVSHHLAQDGDTYEVLEAVLDTNFWLATHVICVTLGYTATYFAGFIGMAYIVARFFKGRVGRALVPIVTVGLVGGKTAKILNHGRLDHDTEKTYSKMLYGMVCFATLLSFVGTVLGGIWADESWGRFWGWDPKENGAVLIVLWNALILHVRWGGLGKTLGLAQLAVVGNMITTWSWFGTNQLGVGLHAYGFSNTLALGCTIAWGVFAGFVVLGWLAKLMPHDASPALPGGGRKADKVDAR